MKMHHALVVAALVSMPLVADARLAGYGDSSVQFTAVGPAGMKIVGTTPDLAVAEDGPQVTVTVPLGNLSTGIGLRDKHMKEKYLQVQTYPTAVLRVARSALRMPAPGGEATADAPGVLTLHGQNHGVTVHYTARGDGGGFTVNGSVHLNMKDYGIDVPSYLGVTVKPDVDVAVRFHAKDG